MPGLVTVGPTLPEAGPSKSLPKPTFQTLEREAHFRRPPTDTTAHPELQKLVAPHIDSFNALFDSGGLLEAAIKDIQPKVVWDGKGKESDRGNRLEREWCSSVSFLEHIY
jgi:DNA-directed RNA polymerase I subunit RPA2